MEFQQVFLSHCVRSAGEPAKYLDEMVREKGLSTFICVDMEAGDGFREAIVGNAANCKVMVLFVDEQWANSKECKSEFNCAYSCFSRNEWPKFVPIVLGGFNWINPCTYPVAHCITSNFQCLMLEDDQTKWESTFEKVIAKCNAIVKEAQPESKETDGADQKDSGKNPSAQLMGSIASFITCEYCQKVFRDPRQLPCNHTFCLECLQKWKKDTEPAPFCCPKCRQLCTIEIEKLPNDLKATQLIKAHEIMEQKTQGGATQSKGASSANNRKESLIKPIKRQSFQAKPPEPLTPITPITPATSAPAVPATPQVEFPKDVKKWFKKHSIPYETQCVLFDFGFEFLELIMGLTVKDLKELGLKTGHKRWLWKSLSESRDGEEPEQSPFRVADNFVTTHLRPVQTVSVKPRGSEDLSYVEEDEIVLGAGVPRIDEESGSDTESGSDLESDEDFDDLDLDGPEWMIVENIYEERALTSGTQPADTLKFWASLSQKEREEFLSRFKKIAEELKNNSGVEAKLRSEKLRKVAMVLQDAGEYADGEAYAREALKALKKEDEGFFVTKVMLCNTFLNKLKMPMYWSGGDDETKEWKDLLNLMNETIEEASEEGSGCSVEMLIKVHILKIFVVGGLSFRDGCEKSEANESIEVARKLCDTVDDKGLRSELLLHEAGLMDDMPAVRKMLEARDLCLQSYGEFSVLMARIYYNSAIELEWIPRKKPLAYQCFRRNWLIYRQITGIHHPLTKKVAALLTNESEGYIQIAKRLGDSLPDDEFLGAGDLDYEERLKPLERLAIESEEEVESSSDESENDDENSDENKENGQKESDENNDDNDAENENTGNDDKEDEDENEDSD